MKRLLLASALLASSLHAEGHGHKLYRWSIAALVAGNAADVASSWGGQEMNPILGRGNFGASQLAIKAAVVGGGLLVQRFVIRHRPENERACAIGNYAVAGAFGGVAARNWAIGGRK